MFLSQAKAIAQPFAYEEYRREKIRKKIEEERANRARQKVRQLFHWISSDYEFTGFY